MLCKDYAVLFCLPLQVLRDNETEELRHAHILPAADQDLQKPAGPQANGDPHPQESVDRKAGETAVLRGSGAWHAARYCIGG